jgi:ketosteroid isomerase-like protein
MSRVELPDGSSYSGPSGFLEFIERWEEGIGFERMEPEEIIDAGEQVVAFVHHQGQGKASGIDVEQHFAMVWTVRDGRAIRMDMYRTREQALEAAGLSE